MKFFFALAMGYSVIVFLLFVFQRQLIYPASRQQVVLNAETAPGFQELTTKSSGNLELRHWFNPPQQPDGPIVLLFHGNAGHAGDRVAKVQRFIAKGYGVFLVGYRGYGGNPGRPSEDGLTADGKSARDWLKAAGYRAEQIVLYGESLGTAVAIRVASDFDIAAVVLEAPPSSIRDVAQARYWFVPVRWLLLDPWDSLSRIAEIDAPLLVLHGLNDRVVPVRFGRRLFDAALEPKTAIFRKSANHVDLLEFPDVEAAVLAFIESHAGRKH